jgi:hypothetical protein
VKRPSSVRWKRVLADSKPRRGLSEIDEDLRLEEVGKTLVADHVIHPDRDKFFEIIGLYPALAPELLEMVKNLARGGAKALAGE